MVMAERSCWRSGTDKRGWAVRSGTARGELAVSDTAEPTAEAWAFAGGQTTSIAAGIPTVLRSGCFRGLIAYSFLFIPSLSRSLYATDLFTRSEGKSFPRLRFGLVSVGAIRSASRKTSPITESLNRLGDLLEEDRRLDRLGDVAVHAGFEALLA